MFATPCAVIVAALSVGPASSPSDALGAGTDPIEVGVDEPTIVIEVDWEAHDDLIVTYAATTSSDPTHNLAGGASASAGCAPDAIISGERFDLVLTVDADYPITSLNPSAYAPGTYSLVASFSDWCAYYTTDADGFEVADNPRWNALRAKYPPGREIEVTFTVHYLNIPGGEQQTFAAAVPVQEDALDPNGRRVFGTVVLPPADGDTGDPTSNGDSGDGAAVPVDDVGEDADSTDVDAAETDGQTDGETEGETGDDVATAGEVADEVDTGSLSQTELFALIVLLLVTVGVAGWVGWAVIRRFARAPSYEKYTNVLGDVMTPAGLTPSKDATKQTDSATSAAVETPAAIPDPDGWGADHAASVVLDLPLVGDPWAGLVAQPPQPPAQAEPGWEWHQADADDPIGISDYEQRKLLAEIKPGEWYQTRPGPGEARYITLYDNSGNVVTTGVEVRPSSP